MNYELNVKWTVYDAGLDVESDLKLSCTFTRSAYVPAVMWGPGAQPEEGGQIENLQCTVTGDGADYDAEKLPDYDEFLEMLNDQADKEDYWSKYNDF